MPRGCREGQVARLNTRTLPYCVTSAPQCGKVGQVRFVMYKPKLPDSSYLMLMSISASTIKNHFAMLYISTHRIFLRLRFKKISSLKGLNSKTGYLSCLPLSTQMDCKISLIKIPARTLILCGIPIHIVVVFLALIMGLWAEILEM